MIDLLWSSEAVDIADHGGRITRFERTRLLADNSLAQRSLRVCYMNYDGAYNCGRCPKCTLTMLSLEALGVREKFTTFPPEFDFAELDEFTPWLGALQAVWADCLRGVEECGREDLARRVRPVVERGARQLADPSLITAQEELAAAQAQLRDILDSRSWRLTAPLRRLGACMRRARVRRTG